MGRRPVRYAQWRLIEDSSPPACSRSQVVAQFALPWQPPLQFSRHSMVDSEPPLQDKSQPPDSEQSMLQLA
jgi:hypothetical protein